MTTFVHQFQSPSLPYNPFLPKADPNSELTVLRFRFFTATQVKIKRCVGGSSIGGSLRWKAGTKTFIKNKFESFGRKMNFSCEGGDFPVFFSSESSRRRNKNAKRGDTIISNSTVHFLCIILSLLSLLGRALCLQRCASVVAHAVKKNFFLRSEFSFLVSDTKRLKINVKQARENERGSCALVCVKSLS